MYTVIYVYRSTIDKNNKTYQLIWGDTYNYI